MSVCGVVATTLAGLKSALMAFVVQDDIPLQFLNGCGKWCGPWSYLQNEGITIIWCLIINSWLTQTFSELITLQTTLIFETKTKNPCSTLCILCHSYCYSEVWEMLKHTLMSDIIRWHCRFLLTACFLHLSLLFLLFFSPSGNLPSLQTRSLSRSAGLVKQASDWMTSCCRYSSLLKSIFPTAALAPAAPLLSLAVLITASSPSHPSVQSDLFSWVLVLAACRNVVIWSGNMTCRFACD